MSGKKYDAIVIGAGIIGCCVAFELAKKGYKTLGLDKLPASGYGSTSGSCAIVRFHYSTPDGVAMAREGYYYWLDWPIYLEAEDPKGMAFYRNTGALVTKNERNKQLVNVMAALRENGIGFLELGPHELERYLPGIDTRSYYPAKLLKDPDFGKPTSNAIGGAIWIPESGFVSDPQLSTHNVQVAAEAKGAEYRFNAKVIDIMQEKGRVSGVVLEDGEEIAAPIVVNVAGPHSFQINRMAGVEEGMNIKTRPLRQEVCHVPAPEGLDWEKNGFMLSDSDTGTYARPEVGNHFLIGSEDPDCDTMEYLDDPDDYNKGFTDQWTTQVMREAQRVPGLPIPNTAQGVVDLYDCSDDWIPIYDKSGLPGFYMAVGTSGNQYKNAPVVGLLMAELIQKVEAGHEHDKDPVSFTMKYTRRPCDIGFYSRLREINENSSFSVIG
jgi:sarcosine oxidase subunit beta